MSWPVFLAAVNTLLTAKSMDDASDEAKSLKKDRKKAEKKRRKDTRDENAQKASETLSAYQREKATGRTGGSRGRMSTVLSNKGKLG